MPSNLNESKKIIEEYLSTIRPKLFKGNAIIVDEFKTLSKPIKKRFIYEYVQLLGLDYDSKKINEVFNFIDENINKRNGSTLSLTTAMWLYTDNKIIETIPRKNTTAVEKPEPVEIKKEGEYKFGDKIFSIKKYNDNELFVFPNSTAKFAYIDITEVGFPLILRTRKDGDIITPLGMKGSMKLKKYMNGKGVSKHHRDNIPLLCSEKEVLWVSGVGLNEKVGVKTSPTHVVEIN